MKEKEYVSIIDGEGKFEVIRKTDTITSIIKDNKIYDIPNIYLMPWNKKSKKSKNNT